MIDHLLSFTNEATAQADAVVGAYYTPASADGPGGWRGDVCIPGVRAIGPSAVAWYIYIADANNPALDISPHIVHFSLCSSLYPLFLGRDLTTVKANVA